MATKKRVSKQEKTLRNKVYYLRAKNKKISLIIGKFNPDVFYSINSKKVKDAFKGRVFKQEKKVKGSTLINILRNKIKDNNTHYDKTFNTLKNKFKKNIKKSSKRKTDSKKGVYLSLAYRAWETQQAIGWIATKSGKNFSHEFIHDIYAVSETMGNYDFFQMEYLKKENEFTVFVIEND